MDSITQAALGASLAGCLVFLLRPPALRVIATGLLLSTAYLGWSFVLAQERDGTLTPADGERVPQPAMNTGALPLLWARTTGAIPVLCLSSLTTPPPGEEC